MAAGDPCGAGLCAGGAGGRQRHLGRYPYRLVSGGHRGIRLLLPPAQSAAPWGETADSRNQKERCVTYELHPICWTVWYTVQQMGCVYMPKGIPQNQIKTKRPEPCAVQDSDRSGRLFLFLSNFWGSLPCGCGSFIILLLQGFSLHVFKGHFEKNAFLPLPHRACAAAFAAPGSAWPYQWALPHDRPCLPPAPVDGPRQRRWP